MAKRSAEDLLAELRGERGPMGQGGAPAPTSPLPPPPVPTSLDFTPMLSAERWRVELFDLLAAELDLRPPWIDAMRLLHEVAMAHARFFLILRRLYGVMPLVPDADANPDDLRVWPRSELCAALGLEDAGLTTELQALRGLYQQRMAPPPVEAIQSAPPPPTKEELTFGEDLLDKYGFSREVFKVEWFKDGQTVLRPAEENRREEEWFTRRVADWRRVLDEPMAHAIGRECLYDELQLRRFEVDVNKAASGTSMHRDLQKLRAQVQTSYGERLKQVQEMFPEMGIAGQVAFKAVMSEVIQGYVQAKASGKYELINRVCTAGELAVDLRQSVQMPEVKHRLGQTLFIIEAMHGIMDPNWRSELKPAFLKRMDAIGKAAAEAVRQDEGDVLVDLAKDGDAGEYPDDDPDQIEPDLPAKK